MQALVVNYLSSIIIEEIIYLCFKYIVTTKHLLTVSEIYFSIFLNPTESPLILQIFAQLSLI